MAMRIGSQGPSQWPDCFERGIAAIGYYYEGQPVVEDCKKITEKEYDNIWRQKRPRAGSPRGSLRNVAYRMKPKDIIYVKEGTQIVGKGVITQGYKYDPNVLAGSQEPWEHYVKVKWKQDFTPFTHKLGAEQTTVLKLEGQRLKELLKKESQITIKIENIEVEEGRQYIAEKKFRQRNRGLIEVKKTNSDYRCEVCGMNFKEKYGKIGEKYIIAHHLVTIGSRKESTTTTLKDIALVCSNCHVMLHRKNPPYKINELKTMLKKQ